MNQGIFHWVSLLGLLYLRLNLFLLYIIVLKSSRCFSRVIKQRFCLFICAFNMSVGYWRKMDSRRILFLLLFINKCSLFWLYRRGLLRRTRRLSLNLLLNIQLRNLRLSSLILLLHDSTNLQFFLLLLLLLITIIIIVMKFTFFSSIIFILTLESFKHALLIC